MTTTTTPPAIQWQADNDATMITEGSLADGGPLDIIATVRRPEHTRFIVTACNSHEELLDACIAACDYLSDPTDEEIMEVFSQLCYAIKKAEGR